MGIEGIDGSGKTTVVRELSKEFEVKVFPPLLSFGPPLPRDYGKRKEIYRRWDENPEEGYRWYKEAVFSLVRALEAEKDEVILDRGLLTVSAYGISYLLLAGKSVKEAVEEWKRETGIDSLSGLSVSIYLDLGKDEEAISIVETRHIKRGKKLTDSHKRFLRYVLKTMNYLRQRRDLFPVVYLIDATRPLEDVLQDVRRIYRKIA